MHTRLGGRLFEGIEVDHDHVDGLDTMLLHSTTVRWILSAVENAPVDFGMEVFHPAIQHFGKAGQFGDIFHRDTGLPQQLGRTPGGNEFYFQIGELAANSTSPVLSVTLRMAR